MSVAPRFVIIFFFMTPSTQHPPAPCLPSIFARSPARFIVLFPDFAPPRLYFCRPRDLPVDFCSAPSRRARRRRFDVAHVDAMPAAMAAQRRDARAKKTRKRTCGACAAHSSIRAASTMHRFTYSAALEMPIPRTNQLAKARRTRVLMPLREDA